jgi:hypothetical protein
MATPKKYFQDHLILLLLSINAFVVFSNIALILAKLSSGHGSSYIVQYRPSLGINAFQAGGVSDLLSFIIFALLVLGVHITLSLRTYDVNRHVAIVILTLSIVLLLLSTIISNALLGLR